MIKLSRKLFLNISLGSFISLLSISSLINIYKNKAVFSDKSISYKYREMNLSGSKSDKYWAKKLLEGGYILHFRHAERQKWIDVQMYDALESDVHNKGINQSRLAENDYFKDAVCLNERGLIQSKAMGEHIKNINFPIGYVISSPSCRSRQTAELAFGGYDELKRILVHAGPYTESAKENTNKLVNLYLSLPILKGTNTIVSSHNSVIHSDMLDNVNNKKLTLEEGGFYVISKKDNKLFLEHEFHNFNSFIRQFYKR